MARLIDADALIASMGLENAVKWGNKDGHQQEHSYSTLMRYEIKREIDSQPTVDAVSVKHGRWGLSDYNGFCLCSVCRDCYIDDTWTTTGKWQYCPNCGAKMDGGDADDHS